MRRSSAVVPVADAPAEPAPVPAASVTESVASVDDAHDADSVESRPAVVPVLDPLTGPSALVPNQEAEDMGAAYGSGLTEATTRVLELDDASAVAGAAAVALAEDDADAVDRSDMDVDSNREDQNCRSSSGANVAVADA